jgi:hypothetical protein
VPKNGHVHPWRVVYLWENGVKGTNTYQDRDAAEFFLEAITRRAVQIDTTVKTRLVNRLEDPTPIAKHYAALEGNPMSTDNKPDAPKSPAQKRKIVLDFLRAVNAEQRQTVNQWTYSATVQDYSSGRYTKVPNPEVDPARSAEAWSKLADYAAQQAQSFLKLQAYAQQQSNLVTFVEHLPSSS